MALTVRVAEDKDVTTLARLRRAWNEENAGGPVDDGAEFEATFARWWAAERSTRTFFIAEVEGAAVGMANVKRYDRMPFAGRPNAGWWGYVGNVFVLEAHRNAGVGRFLMDEIVAWAGPAGMEHLRLAAAPRARSFYSRLGFVAGAVVELDPPR